MGPTHATSRVHLAWQGNSRVPGPASRQGKWERGTVPKGSGSLSWEQHKRVEVGGVCPAAFCQTLQAVGPWAPGQDELMALQGPEPDPEQEEGSCSSRRAGPRTCEGSTGWGSWGHRGWEAGLGGTRGAPAPPPLMHQLLPWPGLPSLQAHPAPAPVPVQIPLHPQYPDRTFCFPGGPFPRGPLDGPCNQSLPPVSPDLWAQPWAPPPRHPHRLWLCSSYLRVADAREGTEPQKQSDPGMDPGWERKMPP